MNFDDLCKSATIRTAEICDERGPQDFIALITASNLFTYKTDYVVCIRCSLLTSVTEYQRGVFLTLNDKCIFYYFLYTALSLKKDLTYATMPFC